MTDLDTALQAFFEGVERIYGTYMAANFPNNPVEPFTMTKGNRYAKINRGGSVHVFVDLDNGDVLKAASYRAPAKGARGNIYDDRNGLGRINAYGVVAIILSRKANN